MRGHRAKQYRKLMHQYNLTFNFREPYQVLLDAAILQDAARFKMNLGIGLERTLQGQIKPMITQCCMRHLYATGDQTLIEEAKKAERRRCGHHELEEPLSAMECILSCVDPKESRTNKNKYIVASQDQEIRARLRRIPGVPLIYISRSVMILEPMASATEGVRARAEKEKFKLGLKGGRGGQALGKRLREEVDDDERSADDNEDGVALNDVVTEQAKSNKKKGVKQPNPLSVKRSQKARPQQPLRAAASEEPEKKKRRRRKKASDAEGQDPIAAG